MVPQATARPAPYDVIVVSNLDRLARQLSETASIKDRLDHAGVQLHVVGSGEQTLWGSWRSRR
jgi:DNA invertase Pin-like site-specific DNA recombinase